MRNKYEAYPPELWATVVQMLTDKSPVRAISEATGIPVGVIHAKNSKVFHIRQPKGIKATDNPNCETCKTHPRSKDRRHCNHCRKTGGAPRTGPRRGPMHYLWKGGVRAQLIRFSPEYVAWRKQVFARDNYTCVTCGANKCFLEADHIYPQSIFPEKRFELSNGRTLCKPCHRKTRTYGIRVRDFPLKAAIYFLNSPCKLPGFEGLTNQQAYDSRAQ